MELHAVLEALIFASDKPLTLKRIISALREAAEFMPGPATEALRKVKDKEVREALEELSNRLKERGSALMVQEVGEAFQLRTVQEAAPWVHQLFEQAKPNRLSQPALETLAIIAYRQPISRADIEAVRGVAVDGVLATLMERKLIQIAGRADIPGRPLLYGTTPDFLETFGLRNTDELPNADELRTIPIHTAESPDQKGGQQPELLPADAGEEAAGEEGKPGKEEATEEIAGEAVEPQDAAEPDGAPSEAEGETADVGETTDDEGEAATDEGEKGEASEEAEEADAKA